VLTQTRRSNGDGSNPGAERFGEGLKDLIGWRARMNPQEKFQFSRIWFINSLSI